MYQLRYSTALLLAFFSLSHARHTLFVSRNGEHSYLSNSDKPDVCMTPQCVISAADVLTSLDEAVDPCDDFFRFACGGWLKRRELEEDQPEIHTLGEMEKDVNRKLKDLLESKHESSEPPFEKMLKDFYSACIDVDNDEKDESEPLKRILKQLGGFPAIEGNDWDESSFDWVDLLISLRKIGYSHKTLLSLSVYPRENADKESVYTIHLGEPRKRMIVHADLALGLDDPNIDLYFRLMVNATKLLATDESAAEKELLDVVNFSIALENCTLTQTESELEEIKGPRFFTVTELQQLVPQIPWLKYLKGILNDSVNENEKLFVHNPIFVIKLVELLSSTEKRTIANYMMIQAVLESSFYLSEEWEIIFENRKKLLPYETDTIIKPRWKNCLSSVAKNMKIALSSFYVRHYFSEESKDKALILLKYIHKEFVKILEENDWMDEKTRKKAEEKANAIKSYIGYPKELLNDTFMMKAYENLTITSSSHLENILALHKMAEDEALFTFGEPFDPDAMNVDEDPKFMHIVEVNAVYSPEGNLIIIPAGILHDAFYVKDRPNYMNFGAIGFVIGHEITHGFDNKGRYFDKDGNFDMWWDEESDKHFRKKVDCIIDQYNNYTTDIGMKVNGRKTQNENIADNGGLKEAYLAYKSWTKDNGIEPFLPGLNYTQNQLFWLSAAHIWCAKYQPEQLKKMLIIDPHSPGQYRIIGPMSNLEEFSKDFKCSADSPMNRKYKCKVW